MTDKILRREFLRLDKRFFGGALDKRGVSVEFYPIPNEGGSIVYGDEIEGEIRINSKLKNMWDYTMITLIHEMIHADLPEYKGDEEELGSHGMIFKARMVELFKAGAYDGLL